MIIRMGKGARRRAHHDLKHHGAVFVQEDAVFAVQFHRPCQDEVFEIPPQDDELLGRMGVGDAHGVLFDDGPFIQGFGDVMGGGPDELDAAGVGLVVGPGAPETRQEGVVDVDDALAEPLTEVRG